MKKLTTLLLSLALLLSAVSCANPPEDRGNVTDDAGAINIETMVATEGSLETPKPDPTLPDTVTADEIYKMLDLAKTACNSDSIVTLSDGTALVCAKITSLTADSIDTASKEELYAYNLYANNVSAVFGDMLMARFPEESILLSSNISSGGGFPHPDHFFLDPKGEGFENSLDAFEKGCAADNDYGPDGDVSVIWRLRGDYMIILKGEDEISNSSYLLPSLEESTVQNLVENKINQKDYTTYKDVLIDTYAKTNVTTVNISDLIVSAK